MDTRFKCKPAKARQGRPLYSEPLGSASQDKGVPFTGLFLGMGSEEVCCSYVHQVDTNAASRQSKQATGSLSTTSDSDSILVVGMATAETTCEVSGKENSHFSLLLSSPGGNVWQNAASFLSFSKGGVKK